MPQHSCRATGTSLCIPKVAFGHHFFDHLINLALCNREDMEDFLDVVPKARCGFLYAGVDNSFCTGD